jgi:hypothetical protein
VSLHQVKKHRQLSLLQYFHQRTRAGHVGGVPHGPEELRPELRRLLSLLLSHTGEGQTQREYTVEERRTFDTYRFRVHPVDIAEESGIRNVAVQADVRVRRGHGWGSVRHVRIFQDFDPAGVDRGAEAPGHDHPSRGDHEIRLV